jgi:sirohydrochlorin ferrochelatase
MKSLLIVAHGSRREASNEEIRQLAARIGDQGHRAFDSVRCAFLEIVPPSIPNGIRQCIADGATEVTVVPYFLAAGRHVVTDIPKEVAQVAAEHPAVSIRITPYLGAAAAISEMILELAQDQEGYAVNPSVGP